LGIVALIALLLFYCLACLCLGDAAVSVLTRQSPEQVQPPGLTALAAHFLLGQGILGSVWIVVALLSLFSPAFIVVTLAVCILVGIQRTRRTVGGAARHVLTIATGLGREPLGWKIITTLVPATMILAFFRAFSLPSWDGMCFYLAFPKLVVITQHLTTLPGFESFVALFGLQSEMHFAALLALGNDIAARLLVWPTGLSAALMLLSVGKQMGLGRRGQWIALAAVYTSRTFINLTGDGKTDLFATALGLAAFYYILASDGGRKATALSLAGLFTGFAIMGKVTYAGALLPGIMLLFIWQYATLNLGSIPVKSLIASLAVQLVRLGMWAALPLIPLLLKNVSVFGQIIPTTALRYVSGAPELTPEATWRTILVYPFALVLSLDPNLYGNLSPLPLAFAPLALFLPRAHSFLRSKYVQLSVAASVGVAFWICFGRWAVLIIRYMLAPLFVLFLLPARGAEYFTYRKTRPVSIHAVIVICIIVPLVAGWQYFRNDIGAFGQYMAGHTLDCDDDPDGRSCVLLAVNKDAAPGDRIFSLSYPRYWLRPDLLQCLSTGQEGFAVHALAGAEARWNYLYDRGFRYFVLDRQFINNDIPDESGNLLDLNRLPQGLKLVRIYEQPNIVVAYRLEWTGQPRPPSAACRPVNDRIWSVQMQ
jgi:hypothetical protein